MIRSGQPKHFESLHARAARENVLNRIVENVAKRQHTGDVRRRHHDRKRRLGRLRISLEIVIVDPTLIPLWLNRSWVVCLWKPRHFRLQSSEARACLQNEKVTVTLPAA